jgi:hypothetical protein
VSTLCTKIGRRGKSTAKGRTRKACWLLLETKKGWKLSLEVDRGKPGSESFPLRGHLFNDPIVAMAALDRLNVVMVHLKEQK